MREVRGAICEPGRGTHRGEPGPAVQGGARDGAAREDPARGRGVHGGGYWEWHPSPSREAGGSAGTGGTGEPGMGATAESSGPEPRDRTGRGTRGELGTEGKAAAPQRLGARGYPPRDGGPTWKVQDGSHEESPDGLPAGLPGGRATVVPVSGRTGRSGRSAPGGSPRVHSGGVVTRLRSPRGMGLHGGARHSTGIVPGGAESHGCGVGGGTNSPRRVVGDGEAAIPATPGNDVPTKRTPRPCCVTGGHVTARARGLRGERGSA